jgi:ankyrin repeat protein
VDQQTEVSPVLAALYRGDVDESERLAGARESLDVFEAAALGRIDALEKTLDAGAAAAGAWAADGFTALHLAAYFGQQEAVDALLAAGADADAQARNDSRVRPIHSAVAGPAPMIAEALLAAGADPNVRQEGGWTALHAAAMRGNDQLVRLLLAAGADPAVANDEGTTAAGLAEEGGFEALARLLRGAPEATP